MEYYCLHLSERLKSLRMEKYVMIKLFLVIICSFHVLACTVINEISLFAYDLRSGDSFVYWVDMLIVTLQQKY